VRWLAPARRRSVNPDGDGRDAAEAPRFSVSKDAHVVRACENAECLVSPRQFLADISRRHANRALSAHLAGRGNREMLEHALLIGRARLLTPDTTFAHAMLARSLPDV
jgi:hypothetical protein